MKIYKIVYDNNGTIEPLTDKELEAGVKPGVIVGKIVNRFEAIEGANELLAAFREDRDDALNYTIVSSDDAEPEKPARKRRVRVAPPKPLELSALTMAALIEVKAEYALRIGFEPTMEQTVQGLINTHKAVQAAHREAKQPTKK